MTRTKSSLPDAPDVNAAPDAIEEVTNDVLPLGVGVVVLVVDGRHGASNTEVYYRSNIERTQATSILKAYVARQTQ